MFFVAALLVALLGAYHLVRLRRIKAAVGLLLLQFLVYMFWSKDWELVSVALSLGITAVVVGGAHMRQLQAQRQVEAQLDADAAYQAEVHRRSQKLMGQDD